MVELILYNNKVECIFDLLGTKEDDITYSFAWCLSKVKPFLKVFLKEIA